MLPAAVSLRVLLPDPGTDRVVGVKVLETPVGRPVTEKTTGALKPPLTETVRVMLLLDPGFIETELAEAAT